MWRLSWCWRRFAEWLSIKVAWALPRRLAYWATVRVTSAATCGMYSDQIVSELLVVDALKRWEIK